MTLLTTVKSRNIDITGDYVVNSISSSGNVSANVIITNGIFYPNGSSYVSGGSGTGPGATAVDSFTGNGTQKVFILSSDPGSAANVLVNYNGTFVSHDSYSVVGTSLTFGSAPVNGSKLEVTILGSGRSLGSGDIAIRASSMVMGIIFGG